VFHGMGKDDAERNWFMCDIVWYMKMITEEASNIVQLDTTFRDRYSKWYMNLKVTTLVG
jgi:hypothetical protein